AGYRFRVAGPLDLVPLLGVGVQVHFVENGGYNGGSGTYADPLVSVRCALEYRLSCGVSLAAAAGYVIFFENENTGMYPLLDLGVQYAF
ncbi:MAG: hypothetical protein JXA20_05840, partial [Spirochaetes bacterium]|nr:hypothetical protein [Spirochaetota bacterium]